MLDIDQTIVGGIAKLIVLVDVDVPSIDDGVLSLPPFEKLTVFVVLAIIIEIDGVLFDVFVGYVVAVEGRLPELPAQRGLALRLVPVLALELGETHRMLLGAAHGFSNKVYMDLFTWKAQQFSDKPERSLAPFWFILRLGGGVNFCKIKKGDWINSQYFYLQNE